MIRIERLEGAEPTDEGTVFHYRAAGRRRVICVPPEVIPALLAALIDTPHRGITEDSPATALATAQFGIATNQETGQPVLGVMFENKLGIVLEADEPLIAALETVTKELKRLKRH